MERSDPGDPAVTHIDPTLDKSPQISHTPRPTHDGATRAMIRRAHISSCGRYRYWLERLWVTERPTMTFIMLNPSTADHQVDDPTIRRCRSFAEREGCGSMLVVNRFALRATDPSELQQADDPHGPENAYWMDTRVWYQGPIVAAWGAHPVVAQRAKPLPPALTKRLLCLGTTKDGSPRHPLYVRADQPLVPWSHA